MSNRVLLLHGWGGSDAPHWQSFIAAEIARDYGHVNFLRFENFDTPKLDVWKEQLLKTLLDFKPDVVVCHSLANTLWFHLCEQNKLPKIHKLYLVAPPSMECKVEELQEFFPVKIPSKLMSEETLLITSTDDPYMTQEEAQALQKELAVEMKVLQNAGHINADSGYTQWQWMLDELKNKDYKCQQ